MRQEVDTEVVTVEVTRVVTHSLDTPHKQVDLCMPREGSLDKLLLSTMTGTAVVT